MTPGVTEIVVSPGVVSATGPGIASVEPQALSLLDADQWHQAFGTTSSTLSGVKVNHKSVIGYPAMWRGINLLANSVGGMPLDIYRNPARVSQSSTRDRPEPSGTEADEADGQSDRDGLQLP